MPIYAYRCAACGHAADLLRKISDPVLTVCPVCGADAFQKQVTAAGFQLKGSGWYVTDFRGDGKGGKEKPRSEPGAGAESAPASDKAGATPPAPAPAGGAGSGDATPAPRTPTAAPAPASGSGPATGSAGT